MYDWMPVLGAHHSRVFFEDSFLRANLEGYAEYASRVRYRLIPGVF